MEVDVRQGLPTFTLVGLPDRAIRESRERVRAALLNSGLEFPQKRLTVNLAPAHVRKAGPSFDLAIAVGLLAASGQIPAEGLDSYALAGELSLSGELRPVRGALNAALGARRAGYGRLLVPEPNAPEAALVEGIEVSAIPTLSRLADLLHGRWTPDPARPAEPDPAERRPGGPRPRGCARPGGRQAGARDRGRGRPQPADGRPAREPARPCSPAACPESCRRRASRRRWRSPRCTAPPGSATGGSRPSGPSARRTTRSPRRASSGGGTRPMPGEITLAHRGVLFLDELPEFARSAVDALRQPLEEGRVEITRGQRTLDFPANAIVVAACNRCPCARSPDRCSCTTLELARYQRRLSGPLVDRIDLVCQVEAVPAADAGRRARASAGQPRADVRARVVAAATAAAGEARRHGRSLQRRHGRAAHAAAGAAGRRAGRAPPGDPRPDRAQRPRSRPGAARGAGPSLTWRDESWSTEIDVDEALSYRLDAWQRVSA